jgi:hypothetical protein
MDNQQKKSHVFSVRSEDEIGDICDAMDNT